MANAMAIATVTSTRTMESDGAIGRLGTATCTGGAAL